MPVESRLRASGPPRAPGATAKQRRFGAPEVVARLDSEVLDTLDERQALLVEEAIRTALPRQTPKLLDLRFRFPPGPGSFFWVVQIGRDSGRIPLDHNIRWLTRLFNLLAGVAVLFALAFAFVFILYIVKNLLGLDFFPGQSFFHD